jgi:hypothetical protein
VDARRRQREADAAGDALGVKPRLVPRRGLAIGNGPVGPRPARRSLDRHHADVALRAQRQELLCGIAVLGIGPQPRVHGEHHGVEVVPAQRLDERGWRGQVVPRDAHELAYALLAGAEDRLGGPAPGVELVDVHDAVQLVQVDAVGVQPHQRLVELGAHAIGVAASRLLADEEPVAHRGHVRADQHLGVAVARRDVEVVHAVLDRPCEAVRRLLRRAAGERRAAEDRHRALVPGAPEPPPLHRRHLHQRLPGRRACNRSLMTARRSWSSR